ncbi:hypothetical protein U732_386 [Clostridium argentinense CDC 2741]|uniref:Radical SAM domain protein n=1 Tax=Clostridium argentinense CDC 2741 TaxID=1418104 RepID=A0A0C1QUU4_9CLOT|nr:hypothetical protein [Clostridium argentinense]KIE44802.1 hypothetical protein U732_386 [Clostridium argentinense CDC 2741]
MIRYHKEKYDVQGLMHDMAINNEIPLYVQLDITNACDCNCVFCFQGNHSVKTKNQISS